jgi:hypothetical protein
MSLSTAIPRNSGCKSKSATRKMKRNDFKIQTKYGQSAGCSRLSRFVRMPSLAFQRIAFGHHHYIRNRPILILPNVSLSTVSSIFINFIISILSDKIFDFKFLVRTKVYNYSNITLFSRLV